MLLTWAEVPGIYLDLDRNVLFCFDHVTVQLVSEKEKEFLLEISNDTKYDATINLLIDHGQSGEALGHSYYERMEKILVPAKGSTQVRVKA